MPSRGRIGRIFDTDIIFSGAAAIRTALGLGIGAEVQGYDADLAALAALSTTGVVARTGTATYVPRTLTAGAGISIDDGDGIAGNPTITATGGVGAWTSVFKTSDQSKTTDTVAADDSQLVATLTANKLYALRLRVFFTANAACDFKYAMVFAGTTTRVTMHRKSLPPASATLSVGVGEAFDASPVFVAGTTGEDGWLEAEFSLSVGASGGIFSFQWAQNTSDASTATVYAGSSLEYKLLN